MQNTKFYPEQEPQPEELTAGFLDAQWNTLRRVGLLLQPGVVPGSAISGATGDSRWSGSNDLRVVASAVNHINVLDGVAFIGAPVATAVDDPADSGNPLDQRTERVYIPVGDSTAYDADPSGLTNTVNRVDALGNPIPSSSGHMSIPLASNSSYSIYIKYLACADTTTVKDGVPQNQYTVNPTTGAVNYVHWVDGYQIIPYLTASVPADTRGMLLLATATTDVGGVVTVTDARTYCGIPTPLVRGELQAALAPTVYAAGSVTLADHINSVADITAVAVTNPHGTTIASIPGLSAKFGVFSDTPTDFYTAGIVGELSSPTDSGPFWPTSGSKEGLHAVTIQLPILNQALYLGDYRYGNTGSTTYFNTNSQVTSANIFDFSDISATPVSGGVAYAAFQATLGTQPGTSYGLYLVFAQQVLVAATSGLAIRYVPAAIGITLGDIAEDPVTALITSVDAITGVSGTADATTVFPLAVVNWANPGGGAAFQDLTDPQTGYTTTGYNVLDLRRFGTVGDANISHDYRCYAVTTTNAQTSTLSRSPAIYGDTLRWIAQGNAVATPVRPVVQTMAKKAGRIRRVIVYSDTVPSNTPSDAANALIVDVTINGTTIFSTKPAMKDTVSANAKNYAGATTGVIMSTTENGTTALAQNNPLLVGTINSAANRVLAGDRIQLWITQAGTNVPGGNDLMVTVCIE